jgi:ATP-dependent DNA helicase RecG
MMEIKEVLTLIKNGENSQIEFKSTFRSDAIDSIVAFANTKGGKIFIGVNDDDMIKDIEIGKESLQNYINQIKQNTEPSVIPDIETFEIEGKSIVIIDVKEYPIKPVSHKGKYYKRVNNSNHQMSPTEISDMHIKVLNLSWDAYEYPDSELDSLDSKKIEKFVDRMNETGRFSIDENIWTTLEKLKLIKDSKPTIASQLLFAKEPMRMHIRVGRFKDDITIIDDRQITDTLFEAVEESMKFIKTYMMVAYEFDGSIKRIEKWDYPIKALREAVLNAVVHRDYREPSDIQIKIYDDKIVIASPGKLYGDMTIEKLKSKNYQSSLRNKLIAEAFYLTGNIEKYGSGFIRIENELREYPHISYEFKEIANAMLLTFYKNQDVGVSKGVSKGVNEGVNQLHVAIQKHPNKRVPFYATELNTSEKNIERWIKQLKEEGKIEFQGSPKTGGYITK